MKRNHSSTVELHDPRPDELNAHCSAIHYSSPLHLLSQFSSQQAGFGQLFDFVLAIRVSSYQYLRQRFIGDVCELCTMMLWYNKLGITPLANLPLKHIKNMGARD